MGALPAINIMERTEKTTCTFCDEQFDTAEARRDHEVQEHPMSHVSELERLLETFQDSMDQALALKQEKEQLEDEVDRLQTEQHIEDSVQALQETTDQLQETKTEKETHLRKLKRAAGSDEVELADPDAPVADDPDLHAPDDASETDITAWQGYDTEQDADNNDVRKQIQQLEHENNVLTATLHETEEVLKRIQRRAEQLTDDADASVD